MNNKFIRVKDVEFTMVYVEGVTFRMGTDDSIYPNAYAQEDPRTRSYRDWTNDTLNRKKSMKLK